MDSLKWAYKKGNILQCTGIPEWLIYIPKVRDKRDRHAHTNENKFDMRQIGMSNFYHTFLLLKTILIKLDGTIRLDNNFIVSDDAN